MAATIADVARAAGVDGSTVSRTFSAPHLVRAQTREKVLAAARDLRYVPNRAARGLVTGRTHAFGVIVADIANPVFPPLIKAAQSRALELDYSTFVADTDENAEVEGRLVRGMTKQVDGIVLASSRLPVDQIAELSHETRLVLVNRTVAHVPCVLMDVATGVDAAVSHLSTLGHQRICAITGPRASWTSTRIVSRARQACAGAGIALTVVGPTPPTTAGGAGVAPAVLATGASAVIGHNDLICIGLMDELRRRSIAVPGQLSVMGFDDSGPADFVHPGLTTVAMPAAAAGRAAVDMLIQLLRADAPTSMRTTLETQLVIRESTARATSSSRRARRSAAPH